MASLYSIPRFLLPRGPLLLRNRMPTSPFLPLSTLRYASDSAIPPRRKSLADQIRDSKPRVIPQPDKYRPPSHGRRTPRSETQQKHYGPKISEEDLKRMRTKKYPNMMAPEGTFMHWFLHNKAIHVWISLGILISLAVAAWYMDFVHKTNYRDLLPSQKDYLYHPIQSVDRFIDIYKMHVSNQSLLAEQRRHKKYEDVEKRRQFRLDRKREAEERGEEYETDPGYFIDEMGTRRKRVKRWLGIWE